MRKVKNSPTNYVKRSQIKPACVVVERVAEAPRKRTAADFASAVIDSNFYVSFRSDPKVEKRK
ncbi:hypothetical protein [Agrobacterium sp. P15N1-A]|uniref:hypothetical protein n=1 Tax=Agrobacterium sp. P15N1-A TaxID=3342820 RepID=UPI0037D05F39